jgi:glycosyltransferase involved in cell wall biosynthesis
MYRDKTIAVVVPAYNEERFIGLVITSMPTFVDHIIVVDDKSTDRTAEVAEATRSPSLHLIRHKENTGVGGAVVTGHRAALELGADVITIMAGDAQCDPAHLHALVDPVIDGRCDMAKGNRFFAVDSFRGMPRFRVAGNIVLSFLTRLSSGYWHIFDPSNGYLAVNRETLSRIPLDQMAKGYQLETDFLINLNIIGARVIDVPIPARYGEETSTIRVRKVVPQVLHLLFRGFWRRVFWKYVLWSFSPIALLFFIGIALTAWGVGIGIWVLVNTLGPPVATTGTVLLSLVPFMLGIQFLISALLLDIQESPGRNS